MALYKTRQLLANYSQQSVRDISVSRLEELYAPIVAQRKAQDEANEREFNLNLPHLARVKKILAQQLEEMATEENAHIPVTSYFDAIQVAKSARVSENDIGVRTLITMLENTWRQDRTASMSAVKYATLVDHFKKNYPRSAVCEVLEKIGEQGYMTLEIGKLAEIASEITDQASYEDAILSNCLQSNTPSCKKARQFILALVNAAEDPEEGSDEEEVGPDVKKFRDLYKELRDKKQRGDKIGNTRLFDKTAATVPLEEVYFDVIVEPETDVKPEDDFEDEETVKWIYEELESGNEWAWCQVQVVAKWEDENGQGFEGRSNWLGGCSYRSKRDFTNPDGYYDDMKQEAYQSLQDEVDDSDTGMKGIRPASKKTADFMEPQVEFGTWVIVDTDQGGSVIPADLVDMDEVKELQDRWMNDEKKIPLSETNIGQYLEGNELYDIEVKEGFGARLSAPGYMDSTDWAVFDTQEEAENYLKEQYGDDDFEDEESSDEGEEDLV